MYGQKMFWVATGRHKHRAFRTITKTVLEPYASILASGQLAPEAVNKQPTVAPKKNCELAMHVAIKANGGRVKCS